MPDGGRVLLTTDITDRREAEARFLAAAESIPDGLAIFDAEDRFVFYNSRYPGHLTDEPAPGPAPGPALRRLDQGGAGARADLPSRHGRGLSPTAGSPCTRKANTKASTSSSTVDGCASVRVGWPTAVACSSPPTSPSGAGASSSCPCWRWRSNRWATRSRSPMPAAAAPMSTRPSSSSPGSQPVEVIGRRVRGRAAQRAARCGVLRRDRSLPAAGRQLAGPHRQSPQGRRADLPGHDHLAAARQRTAASPTMSPSSATSPSRRRPRRPFAPARRATARWSTRRPSSSPASRPMAGSVSSTMPTAATTASHARHCSAASSTSSPAPCPRIASGMPPISAPSRRRARRGPSSCDVGCPTAASAGCSGRTRPSSTARGAWSRSKSVGRDVTDQTEQRAGPARQRGQLPRAGRDADRVRPPPAAGRPPDLRQRGLLPLRRQAARADARCLVERPADDRGRGSLRLYPAPAGADADATDGRDGAAGNPAQRRRALGAVGRHRHLRR